MTNLYEFLVAVVVGYVLTQIAIAIHDIWVRSKSHSQK